MWLVQYQRLDQIGPISHMGPSLKKWLVQYIRWDQIGPMTHLGPGPISDIGPGPMWHMGLAYYWQVRFLANVVAISAHYTYKQSASNNVSCSSFDLV